MRIAVLIPDRGDRPDLLKNCLRMMMNQTLQPAHIELVNDTPLSDKCDITWRYRTGYDRLRNKNFDIIAFIENDDWYSSKYLETMANYWLLEGKPDLLGLDHTIYYNIRLFAYFTMFHSTRSSAMNTLIKPDLDINFGVDEDPYTDAHLWNTIRNRKIVVSDREICMGIKHGIGKCGGQSHTCHLSRYTNNDSNKKYLKSIMDDGSFRFYSEYFNSSPVIIK